MARHSGKNARVMVSITSGGTAEPISGVHNWTANRTTAKTPVPAFGDTNIQYVSGLPDAQGTINGWWDDATQQLYTAAADGIARKAYFYRDFVATPGVYDFATILIDVSDDVPFEGGVGFTSQWAAASPLIKVG